MLRKWSEGNVGWMLSETLFVYYSYDSLLGLCSILPKGVRLPNIGVEAFLALIMLSLSLIYLLTN